MHAERLVVGNEHGLGCVPPSGRLIQVDPELPGALRVALDGVGRCLQILLRHEVGVYVIVGDGTVLVRAGDTVDAEAAVGVVVTQREPEPGSLYEQLEAGLELEGFVAGGHEVADDGGCDVGVDVEGGRAGGAVTPERPAPGGAAWGGGPHQT